MATAVEQARTSLGDVVITISGTCNEAVTLQRNNRVTLRGAASGGGLTAPDGAAAVTLKGVQNIVLQQLTLEGGSTGLTATNGSSFVATYLHVIATQNGTGVDVAMNASGTLSDSIVEGGRFGLSVKSGGALVVNRGQVVRNSAGVFADRGGHATLYSVSVADNGYGMRVLGGASINLSGTVVERSNSDGAKVDSGGSLYVGGGAVIKTTLNGPGIQMSGGSLVLDGGRVTDNAQFGIHSDIASSVVMDNGASVDSNGGNGLELMTGSSALVVKSSIFGNGGHGVFIRDTSSVSFGPSSIGGQVLNNTGWGLYCYGPPEAPQVIGSPTVSGNGGGNSNCLGFIVR